MKNGSKNIVDAIHFARLAWIDLFNTEDTCAYLFNPYRAIRAIRAITVFQFDSNGRELQGAYATIPAPSLLLLFQLILSTVEKSLKSIMTYEGHKLEKKHNLKKLVGENEAIIERNYEYASGHKTFCFNDIRRNSPQFFSQLFELDYTILRYESGKMTNDFQIDFRSQDVDTFIKSLREFLQHWINFLYEKNGHQIQYPKEIKPINQGFSHEYHNDLPKILSATDKWITITNKNPKEVNLPKST